MKNSPHNSSNHKTIAKKLLIGASICALSTSLSISAHAQTSDTTDEDEIVVTGIRSSLENSQEIKRNADTFVDSITATDIGALPDRSVLEAIQRVPGVSINRFEGGSDPDHFSVEGSGLVIRGLDFVRSEFNGRDTFSANNGRSLGFGDVPPELVGGVDVFKNQTADMVEGGISGVVNLKTLKPFDRSERTIAATVDATYSDYRDEISPSVSALISDRWDTKHGEFGLLVSGAYSNLKSRSAGFRIAPPYPYALAADGSFNGRGDPTTPASVIAAPAGSSLQDQQFDRDRLGLSVAGQWASNDGRHIATAEFIRSESDLAWTERTLQAEEDPDTRAGYRSIGPVTTSPFTSAGILVDRDPANNPVSRIPVGGGLFSSGVLTDSSVGWTGRQGVRLTGFTRVSNTEAVTSDYSFNYKFTPNDHWKFNFDAQYVDSTTENSDISVFSANHTDIGLTGIGTDSPTVEFTRNAGDAFAGTDLTNPDSQYWRAAMDHFEDSEGDELALRADIEHEFKSDGWFKSVRIGGRYSERDQLTRWTEYNWQNLSEAWNGGYRSFGDTSDSSLYETFSFGDFRSQGSIVGQTDFLFPAASLVGDYEALLAFANSSDVPNAIWAGVAQRGGTNTALPDGSTLESGPPQNGRYYDSEISRVVEDNLSLYARVDFSNEDFADGITVDGNYGVRIVSKNIESTGSLDYREINDTRLVTFLAANDPVLLSLFNGANSTERTIENGETFILPSFNVKFGLTDDLIARFAAGKGISYPDIGSLRAYRQFASGAQGLPIGGGPAAPITGVSTNFEIYGGNPNLKPIQAINLDASLEYYFGEGNSLTASVFYKDLSDVIINGTERGETVTLSDGRTIDFSFIGPINGADGKVKGFELAYQQFYDFLPGIFSGLGFQANYTYVDQTAIPNGGVRSQGAIARDNIRFTPEDLENLSKHTVNLIGLYENDKIEARVAYNWRSDFLLTTTDVITRLPVYNESTGQLDASFKYRFTDNFQVGVQGVNLLSEVTETSVQVDDAGQRLPRSYFENDRRISLIGSFTF